MRLDRCGSRDRQTGVEEERERARANSTGRAVSPRDTPMSTRCSDDDDGGLLGVQPRTPLLDDGDDQLPLARGDRSIGRKDVASNLDRVARPHDCRKRQPLWLDQAGVWSCRVSPFEAQADASDSLEPEVRDERLRTVVGQAHDHGRGFADIQLRGRIEYLHGQGEVEVEFGVRLLENRMSGERLVL